MAMASMIVQPVPASAARVAAELALIPGVTVHGTTDKQEIIILVEGDGLDQLRAIAEKIQAHADVYGIFPAYVTTADAEERGP